MLRQCAIASVLPPLQPQTVACQLFFVQRDFSRCCNVLQFMSPSSEDFLTTTAVSPVSPHCRLIPFYPLSLASWGKLISSHCREEIVVHYLVIFILKIGSPVWQSLWLNSPPPVQGRNHQLGIKSQSRVHVAVKKQKQEKELVLEPS